MESSARMLTMLKTICVSLFVITLVAQFHTNAAAFDLVGLLERFVFGSTNNLGQVTYSRVLLEGNDAERKFIDNEVNKVSQPKILKSQILRIKLDFNRWLEYHRNANFFMRKIAEFVMDTLWERGQHLYKLYREAMDEIDLEPFCHYRNHNNDSEVDLICQRAFQNRFFQDKGWVLDDNEYKYCSRVTISKIEMNEHNRHPKLAYYREARRCSAYIKKTPESKRMYFSVYLISHEVYLKKKQFAYFVLLNRDIAEKKVQKRIVRYLKFWEETRVRVAAYIES